ncbi:MAG: hypothetical protein E6J91_00785 [Deltaproteobacteria bacterium]|nr:MAG: hypothetical protein E6J91_00785 [Deltaproteobacteria bacterium]
MSDIGDVTGVAPSRSYATIARMRRPMTSALLLLSACEARLSSSSGPGDVPDATAVPDAAIDAASDAAPLGRWSPAAPVQVAATPAVEDDVTLSSDAREMVFAVAVAGTNTKDLYYTFRTSTDTPWAAVVKLPFDTDASEEAPRFSGDNKTLYFASDRVTAGDLDIYSVSHDAAGSTMWGAPRPVTAVNTGATQKWFAPCGIDRYVVVQSTTDAGTDLFEGTLGGGPPAPLTRLNSADSDTGAFLTQDCLTIYFASFRTTPEKIFVSHRLSVTAPWDLPIPVDDFPATGGNQEDPWLSADKRTFAFASDAAGTKDIYLSTR